MAIRSSAEGSKLGVIGRAACLVLLVAVVAAFAVWALSAWAPLWVNAVVIGVVCGLVTAVVYVRMGRRLQAAEDTAARLNESLIAVEQKVKQGQSVIAGSPNGVVSVDCEGRITLFNPVAEQMFGRSEQAVLGRRIEDVDLHPELARLSYDCISSETTSSCELRLPGWPVRVLVVRSVSLGGTSPGSDCAMLVIQDVSDVRRRQMHEREFVSNVSHELRTPITAILTTTEALLGGAKNDPEVVDRFLGTIMSEGKRLSALIEDLLEVTKRDYGIVTSKIGEVLVDELIDRAIEAVRPQAGAGGVELSVDVPTGSVAYGDEIQMLRLVRNLADNAVKYTPNGGKVGISAHEDGSDLVISVSDTGIGIPQGEVDRIFERFYRVDKARSRRMGGTGLGLAIVKDIVDSCGGRISVETQLGSGSVFTVWLPMRQDPAEIDEARHPEP